MKMARKQKQPKRIKVQKRSRKKEKFEENRCKIKTERVKKDLKLGNQMSNDKGTEQVQTSKT